MVAAKWQRECDGTHPGDQQQQSIAIAQIGKIANVTTGQPAEQHNNPSGHKTAWQVRPGVGLKIAFTWVG
jgi:hypothetical protein